MELELLESRKSPVLGGQACDRDLLAFGFAVFCRGRVKCCGDMGTVNVKEVVDLLETEFVAEAAHHSGLV